MAGLLSGLGDLGLDFLEKSDVFAEDEKKKEKSQEQQAKAAPVVKETDLIYDKEYVCPVCDKKFTAKIMKTGKAKLVATDFDLKPTYEGIEAGKYDVLLCGRCGYAALGQYFPTILPAQAKMIKENISKNVRLNYYNDETYSFDQALERYKLALANAVVKKAKISEKSYICMKTAWVLRGYQDALKSKGEEEAKITSLKAQEEEYLKNAYTGFLEAVQKEPFPICRMDQTTMDYLLAQLSFHFGEYDISARMVQSILANPGTPARIKDKARDLKEAILKVKQGQ